MKDLHKQALLACLLFVLAIPLGLLSRSDGLLTLLGRSAQAAGLWLRNLSLSGGAGNALAWALVLAISALPAPGLLCRPRRRADWLLLPAGLELLAGLWGLVNPSLLTALPGLGELPSLTVQMWTLTVLGAVLGTLCCWLLLRLLARMEDQSAALLPRLLLWTALGFAFLLGFSSARELAAQIAAAAAGNTDPQRVLHTGLLLVCSRILSLLPQLLGALVLLLMGRLTLRLDADPFSPETVELAERLSRSARRIAALSLVLTALSNGLQLLFFTRSASLHVEVPLPLFTLVLCAVLMVLCRYFRRAKSVNDDNASII